jgi:hypothetical protein
MFEIFLIVSMIGILNCLITVCFLEGPISRFTRNSDPMLSWLGESQNIGMLGSLVTEHFQFVAQGNAVSLVITVRQLNHVKV